MHVLNSFANIGWNKETLVRVSSFFGIAAILSFIAWVARKIFILGKIMQRLESVEKDIKDVKKEVRNSGKDLAKRIDDLMIAVAQAGLTEARSPRQLSAEGKRILKDSGIDEVVDSKFNLIVKRVKAMNPENAYQAEKAIIDTVREIAEDPTIKDAVEEGAFNSGSLASVVPFVGAIYVRDRVLQQLGLKPEEIDKHSKPTN